MRQVRFEVHGSLIVLIRSMVERQSRRKGKFPQMFNDFAVIAHNPGTRSDNFKPLFEDKYKFIPTNYSRLVNLIDKIPVSRPKLT